MWLLIAGYIWLQQSSSSASKLISSSSFFSQNFKTFNSIIWYHQALLPVSQYFNNTCLSLWRSKMMMWHYTRIKFKKKKKTVRWGSAVTLCIHVCSFFSKQKWNAPLWFLSLVSEKERLCNRKWGWRWQKRTGSEVRPDLVTSLTLTFSVGCLSNQCSRWDSF